VKPTANQRFQIVIAKLPTHLPCLVFLTILGLNAVSFVTKLGWLAHSFTTPRLLCSRDFISIYLLAKSVLAGFDPYLRLRDLATHWPELASCQTFEHPSPHPPVLAVLAAPLGLAPYRMALLCWLVMQCAGLVIAAGLLTDWWGESLSRVEKLAASAAFLCAGPVIFELLLLLLSWRAFRNQQAGQGGAWLGLAISIKMMAWPVLFLLVLTRRWRGVWATTGTLCLTHLLAASVLGFSTLLHYYLKAGPLVAQFYRGDEQNYSVWTLGARLFGAAAANSEPRTYLGVALPLWPAPALASALTVLLPLALIVGSLLLARQAQNFDLAFAQLLTISLITNPVAWYHYFVIAVIPVSIAARYLRTAGYPRHLLLSGLAFYLLHTRFSAIALLGLLWLLWRLERQLAAAPRELAQTASA
jgi:alpha-1,2-mannosyltransferase